jgi:hygromycin-B 7''-O-kinase
LVAVSVLLPEIRTWAEWGKMFTDVQLWAPVVRAICCRESILCQDVEAGYPGTHAVYIVDRAYVVKVYAPFCREDYDLECDLYPILACNPQIPAPLLLAHGTWRDRIDWPYIVMDYVPGRPIGEVQADIPPSNRVGIASHLGCILRQLHSTPLDPIRALDPSGQDWQQFVRLRKTEFVREFREREVLPPNVIDQCAEWLESVWNEVQAEHLVLLNGDVTEDHVLVERQDGTWRVSGLIDFGDALIGPAEYEWIALWFGALDCEAQSMRAFLASYDPDIRIDEGFVRRAMALTMLHEFSAGIVRWVLERLGDPPVRCLEELEQVLWGSLFDGRNGEQAYAAREECDLR